MCLIVLFVDLLLILNICVNVQYEVVVFFTFTVYMTGRLVIVNKNDLLLLKV